MTFPHWGKISKHPHYCYIGSHHWESLDGTPPVNKSLPARFLIHKPLVNFMPSCGPVKQLVAAQASLRLPLHHTGQPCCPTLVARTCRHSLETRMILERKSAPSSRILRSNGLRRLYFCSSWLREHPTPPLSIISEAVVSRESDSRRYNDLPPLEHKQNYSFFLQGFPPLGKPRWDTAQHKVTAS